MVMMIDDSDELFENEWYLVRYSGETPEIALHSAIYFLTRAKEGPKLVLRPEQRHTLENAAYTRFEEIVLRDMDHSQVGTSVYRGLARSIVNYRRFVVFCQRHDLCPEALRQKAMSALARFLLQEIKEVVTGGTRSTVINCNYSAVRDFAERLGLCWDYRFSRVADLFPDKQKA